MSQGCPVSPEELRNAAAYCNRMNPGLAHKLRAAADWLEKPAPAAASEPTRGAEGQECTCGVVIQEGPFVYAPEVPDGAVLKIEYCELHQPAPPAQARPTQERLRYAIWRGLRVWKTSEDSRVKCIADEIMKLLEGE